MWKTLWKTIIKGFFYTYMFLRKFCYTSMLQCHFELLKYDNNSEKHNNIYKKTIYIRYF